MITIEPYWHEPSIPVVFASDCNYIPYLSVAILSLIDHARAEHKYDIIILADEKAINEEAKLQNMCSGRDNISIRCIDMTSFRETCSSFGVRDRLSVAAYYRLYISSICADYDKILYMDCDVLCQADVAELYNMDMGDHLVTAAYDKPIQAVDSEWLNGARAYIESIGMKDARQCFNSGVLVMNLAQMRKENTEAKLLEVAARNKKYWHDQSVLNICCQGRVLWVPEEWNFTLHMYGENELSLSFIAERRTLLRDKTYRIIHYAASQKPWKQFHSPLIQPWWETAIRTPYQEEIRQRVLEKLTMPLTSKRCLKLGGVAILSVFFPSRYRKRLISRLYSITENEQERARWHRLWSECLNVSGGAS